MEGQVTEVVEGKAWVVPGVLSPEVSQLSVGSPFFTFTMSSLWGHTNYDFGQLGKASRKKAAVLLYFDQPIY